MLSPRSDIFRGNGDDTGWRPADYGARAARNGSGPRGSGRFRVDASRYRCEGEAKLPLKAGQHSIRIERLGFVSETVAVDVLETGNRPVTVQLAMNRWNPTWSWSPRADPVR